MLHAAIFAIISQGDDEFVEDGEFGGVSAASMEFVKFVLEYFEHFFEKFLCDSKQFLVLARSQPGNAFLVVHGQETSIKGKREKVNGRIIQAPPEVVEQV